MANNRIEYRFVLDAYTPETIPQAKLAQYLADLSELYGEQRCVHFVKVDSSSLAIVSAVEADADMEVSDRLRHADSDAASPDVKKAYQSLTKLISDDGGVAYIEKNSARVLEFPTGQLRRQQLAYGPFWQQGHLNGMVILLGGKTDRVSVKILDANGETHTCKADRAVAKRLRDFLFSEHPIRVIGQGRWRRETDGRWHLEQFDITDFEQLSDEPLTDTVARLRAIEARWKERPDPLAEIEELRRGN
jgi:hypothetical protein